MTSDSDRKADANDFLWYWLWSWPIIATVLIALNTIDPSALRRCQRSLMVPGLIGTFATAWVSVRMATTRFLMQWIASIIALVAGCVSLFYST